MPEDDDNIPAGDRPATPRRDGDAIGDLSASVARRLRRGAALGGVVATPVPVPIDEQLQAPQPGLEQPQVEGRGRAQGDALRDRTGPGGRLRERLGQALGDAGRQRQDEGIGIGFSTTFGEGRNKQTFGVIGDVDKGLGGMGAGVVRSEAGYDFGLGSGSVGGAVKVTTLDDVLAKIGAKQGGGSQGGSGGTRPSQPAGGSGAPPASGADDGRKDADRERRRRERDQDDTSGEGAGAVDTNTEKGDYPPPDGDPVAIPTPEEGGGNGLYTDGSDGTPAPTLERKAWLDPRGVSAGGDAGRRANRRRPGLGPIRVGPADGDGRGTGDPSIGTGSDRPDIPVIDSGRTGFKPVPCPEDELLANLRLKKPM